MNKLKKLSVIFIEKNTRLVFLFTFLVSFLLLFLFTERNFLFQALSGSLPIDLLLKIFPSVFVNYVFGDSLLQTLHVLITPLLMATYGTLLWYLFSKRKYLSVKSLPFNISGLVGVSLGISCLSCGAVSLYVVLSTFGIAVSSATWLTNSDFLLVGGELMLLVSIYLVLLTISKFEK